MTETTSTSVHRFSRLERGIMVACVLLCAFHLVLLPSAWSEWKSGQPDLYPGQHYRLFLGHVTGLAISLVIPMPTFMRLSASWSRNRRVALWVLYGALMSIVIASLVLDLRSLAA